MKFEFILVNELLQIKWCQLSPSFSNFICNLSWLLIQQFDQTQLNWVLRPPKKPEMLESAILDTTVDFIHLTSYQFAGVVEEPKIIIGILKYEPAIARALLEWKLDEFICYPLKQIFLSALVMIFKFISLHAPIE